MNAPRNLDPDRVSIGEMLAGRYSLQGRAGEGAGLWLAHDELEDRPVLLRLLPREMQQDPRALEELRRQVELGRGLDHPLLVGVQDLVVEPEEPAFLVLEQAEGRTLASLQREQAQGVFAWDWLQPRAKQVCEALHYAHEHQVVHGGVHPENIVINRLGDARLLLCGVSTVLAHPLYSGTVSQEHLGYLSPQLLEGKTPAASDDVYALGVLLYQALSGTTPFYGEDLLSQIPQPSSRLSRSAVAGTRDCKRGPRGGGPLHPGGSLQESGSPACRFAHSGWPVVLRSCRHPCACGRA